ncbi:MAG: hypothetical protein EOP60_00365 [Sphingomonadales bacterium]|nr:MAG: hypothetical protein EOP60_00365 [Sphingomonadales bacterium]
MVALVLLAGTTLGSGPAAAQFYIGPSYLFVPGTPGDAKEPSHEDWIRAEARYWTERPKLPEIRGITALKNDLLFSGTTAPTQGPNVLTVSIDKRSPALPALMERCRRGERLAEIRYAESAEIARHPQEHGPKPADVPDFYDYVLSGVTLDCPTADAAPEQALRLRFEAIRWTNHRPQGEPRAITARPAVLQPARLSGNRRTFVVSWFAAVTDAAPGQCPRMNSKPSPADYFALLPQDKAARLRAELADKGVGPDRMPYRGPAELDVSLLPGIVADPGHQATQADVVQGFDLDGDDGRGPPPAGVRAHKNFISPDGRRGIDNQLFTVEACVEGLRRKGFLPMIFNEGRAAGQPSALVEISGIDDERNDDDVRVTLFYSEDGLRRSPAKVVLPDYTFRVSASPEFTQDFVRLRGRIVDGVVMTEPGDRLHVHEVTGIETTFVKPRMRLEFTPEGGIKGVIGGYLDWRKRLVFQIYRGSDYENTVGLQAPAIYNAMKRAADGLRDPATGEFNGISAAFEVEGVPAFVPPDRAGRLAAGR